MLWWLGSAITRVAESYHNDFILQGLTFGEFGYLMFIAIGLGFCGSLFSVRRYVSQIEPEML
jgi:cell division protein FtsX